MKKLNSKPPRPRRPRTPDPLEAWIDDELREALAWLGDADHRKLCAWAVPIYAERVRMLLELDRARKKWPTKSR